MVSVGTGRVVVTLNGTSAFTVLYTTLPSSFAWCQIACNLARASLICSIFAVMTAYNVTY